MSKDEMVELIGNQLIVEIKELAKQKNVDVRKVIDHFESMIDINIVNPDISADEVAQSNDQGMDIDNLKEEVLYYVHEQLNQEYIIPMFLN